jgi:hypothetical protein
VEGAVEGVWRRRFGGRADVGCVFGEEAGFGDGGEQSFSRRVLLDYAFDSRVESDIG